MRQNVTISPLDVKHLEKIRANVNAFLRDCAREYADRPGLLLDIAPQVHEGARAFFKQPCIETLDIDPASGCTYIADLCQNNENIPGGRFDWVVCTEVLEHTLQPFDAVKEIYRLLKPGGLAFLSTPFNFRVHGPLPDCWRFTEYGLRALLKDYDVLRLDALESDDRDLMPIHHTVVARKRAR